MITFSGANCIKSFYIFKETKNRFFVAFVSSAEIENLRLTPLRGCVHPCQGQKQFEIASEHFQTMKLIFIENFIQLHQHVFRTNL